MQQVLHAKVNVAPAQKKSSRIPNEAHSTARRTEHRGRAQEEAPALGLRRGPAPTTRTECEGPSHSVKIQTPSRHLLTAPSGGPGRGAGTPHPIAHDVAQGASGSKQPPGDSVPPGMSHCSGLPLPPRWVSLQSDNHKAAGWKSAQSLDRSLFLQLPPPRPSGSDLPPKLLGDSGDRVALLSQKAQKCPKKSDLQINPGAF